MTTYTQRKQLCERYAYKGEPVKSCRVTPNRPALLRQPLTWIDWPVLVLSRVEGGERRYAVLVDHPGVPATRVFYASLEWVKLVLAKYRDPAKVLAARKTYIDYRTPDHMLDDGWDVD